MNEKAVLNENITKDEAKEQIKFLKKELANLQRELKEAKLPVIILLEGLGASGKGNALSEIISELDPRLFKVYTRPGTAPQDVRRPYLHPFWGTIPSNGEISILEHSWYNIAFNKIYEDNSLSNSYIKSINTFERQLCDDGYLVIKLFLSITKQEQQKRLLALQDNASTAWRVSEHDWVGNEKLNDRLEIINSFIEKTDFDHAKWEYIDNNKRWFGSYTMLSLLVNKIKSALDMGVPMVHSRKEAKFDIVKTTPLKDIDLSEGVSDDDYKKILKAEKKRLQELHGYIYKKKIPVVLAFEGWDAAGKGGAIRRLSWALDPRGFDVIPVAAPTADELAHHYLWRFWKNIPKDGHITLFDRTWYGRVMVERLEGFAPEVRWKQAFTEINEFEKELSNWGAVVIKFWLHIDKKEQLRRFEDRQNTPEKQHKITDEDWRNREKWDEYEVAVDEMIEKTNTVTAPWVIVEGNDKKFARLKILRTVREALEKKLGLD